MQWFLLAEKLLKEERIFSSYDLPYSTQLVPLSAVCTVLMDGNRIHTTSVKKMVKQWYWCGVLESCMVRRMKPDMRTILFRS